MKKVITILLAYIGLIFSAMYLFVPIYAIFVEQIGGTVETAGFAYALFCFAAGILIIILSKWEDKVKHRGKLLALGALLNCFAFVYYFFITSIAELFVAQFLLGLAAAIYLPTHDAMYSEHLDKGKFASEWGDWEAVNYFMTAIAAALGGILVSLYSFRLIFIIMACLSFLAFLISLKLVKING